MKKCIYLLLVLVLSACQTDFELWKDLNSDWLEKNKTEIPTDSLIVSNTGLQYVVYHNGYGAIPKTDSYVKVTYTGQLIDGTVVDTGTEVWLYVGDLVTGWQEALCTMRQGSHWRLYIPSDLAYGEDGSEVSSGNYLVPPYSTLIFDLEINDVINQ